jgi:hypothetical protein
LLTLFDAGCAVPIEPVAPAVIGEGEVGGGVVEVTRPRFQVERLQHGRPPEMTEGAGCHPIDPVHVCDLDAGVIE